MSVTPLAAGLEVACERWSERPAVTHGPRTLTYGELWEAVSDLAGALAELGVRPGERVISQLPTRPEHVIVAGAVWECGAVYVGAHKDLTPPELATLVTRTDPSAVIVQPPPGGAGPLAYGRAVKEAEPRALAIGLDASLQPGQQTLVELLSGGPSGSAPRPTATRSREAGDADMLVLTSGTTGTSKAVMETLPSVWAKSQFFADAFSPGPDDVHLMFLPLSHAFGLTLWLAALCSGGRLVMLDRFSPEAALQLAADEQATVLPGTPAHFAMLLAAFDPGRHDLTRLRWAVTAASPLPRPVIERVYEQLGVELFYVYGCSEGFLTVTTDRHELLRGSVGRDVYRGPAGTPPDGTVTVIDPESHEPLARGEIGEIAYGARAPVRYWRERPVATDGWYRTGDLGYLDVDGCLFVVGRLKDVVNRGGLKVVPGEIEAALFTHPAVADCAVIPAPDPMLGEAVCACVVPSTTPTPDLRQLRSFLAPTIARHKLPDELCFLDALPRTPAGKLDRAALARLVVGESAPRERLRSSGELSDVPRPM